MVIAILGAGPHGQEIANLHPGWALFDDALPGYKPCSEARHLSYVIGAVWPKVRLEINDKHSTIGGAWKYGRVVFPGARISPTAQLGEHVHVLYNAVVSHGCQIGDFSTIAAGAVLAGEVTVESGVFIGANAVVRHGGITIGRNAIIGMGAVVVDDVPENQKWVGNPARPLVPA